MLSVRAQENKNYFTHLQPEWAENTASCVNCLLEGKKEGSKKKKKKRKGGGWKWANKGVDNAICTHPIKYPSVQLGYTENPTLSGFIDHTCLCLPFYVCRVAALILFKETYQNNMGEHEAQGLRFQPDKISTRNTLTQTFPDQFIFHRKQSLKSLGQRFSPIGTKNHVSKTEPWIL